MAATSYLEKYLDCVDALPVDLQRFVTGLREVDRETQGLLVEVRRLECDLEVGQLEGGGEWQKKVLLQLQSCMLRLREASDEKLSISSQLLDTVEDYTQQLSLRLKSLDNPRSDEHHHAPRYAHLNSHSSVKGESPVSIVCEGTSDKSQGKKSISAKRQRSSDKAVEEEGGAAMKESAGRSRENSTAGSATPQGGGKPPKKKIKVKKRSAKEPAATLPTPTQVPMPDLNSQPLDPDEPTYCLCNQVSFGEMIGCDNEECPIEWFHFQCVGLTSKPKGKWYCPQCTTDKKQRATK